VSKHCKDSEDIDFDDDADGGDEACVDVVEIDSSSSSDGE
jgi:hypothetical protein